MLQTKHIAALLIAVCLAGRGEAATPLEPPTAAGKIKVESHGRAYLFRGLIGLINWGMDELAQRISRAGVTADINSHLMWRSVAAQAVSDYRRDRQPITLIGHSMGGDSAVEFAKYLNAERVPVNLLITYDPTRFADKIPANVERYINLYQSSNILGGGDVLQGSGFHGHYASFNLKDRPEVIHINLDKFDRIQEQLTSKIKSLAATPARLKDEAVPLRIVTPAAASIELWDSGLTVSVDAGETLQSIAATYHVPVWALAQINRTSEQTALTEGRRIVVPRYLVPLPAPSPASTPAPVAR